VVVALVIIAHRLHVETSQLRGAGQRALTSRQASHGIRTPYFEAGKLWHENAKIEPQEVAVWSIIHACWTESAHLLLLPRNEGENTPTF
jgi:hypothetical protein